MKIDGDLAELMGIHIGDGCISENDRYSEYYLGGDITEEKEYHDTWVGPLFNRKIMQRLFKRDVNYKEHPKVGVYGFYIFDKKLVDFFNKELGIKSGPKINMGIPQRVISNNHLLKRFIRGLFDTDGSLYFDKNCSAKSPTNNKPVIKLGTVSERLVLEVFNSLKRFGLHPRMKKPYKGKRDKNVVYTVLIYRKADIEFFIHKIGFKNIKHSSKWLLFKKLGYCPSSTKLEQRKSMLVNNSKNL
jgi:intein/homing endonuclease